MLWEIGVSLLEMSQEAGRKSCGLGVVTSLLCLTRSTALSSEQTGPEQCGASCRINKPFSISTLAVGLPLAPRKEKGRASCCVAL